MVLRCLYGWVNGEAERLTDEECLGRYRLQIQKLIILWCLGRWRYEDRFCQKRSRSSAKRNDDDTAELLVPWRFKSNGKRFYNGLKKNKATDKNVKTKRINGRKYGFDEPMGIWLYDGWL